MPGIGCLTDHGRTSHPITNPGKGLILIVIDAGTSSILVRQSDKGHGQGTHGYVGVHLFDGYHFR